MDLISILWQRLAADTELQWGGVRGGRDGGGLDEMTIGPRDLVKTTQIPYLNTPDAASLAAAHLSVVFCWGEISYTCLCPHEGCRVRQVTRFGIVSELK